MADARRAPIVTAEDVRARLAELKAQGAPVDAPAPAPPPVSDVQRRCRRAVVLLDYFTLESLSTPSPPLRPPPPRRSTSLVSRVRDAVTRSSAAPTSTNLRAGQADPEELAELNAFVARDCDLVTTRLGTGWRLRLPVRHEVLRELGVDGVLREIGRPDAVLAGTDDVTHQMARRLLEGERELRGLLPSQLSGILRAVEWLAPLGLDLPTEPAVRAALDLANVLAPLRTVAGADFVGRERELKMLEEHLMGGDPDGEMGLAIHGPGGVGKSALLAKFVLDHVGRGQAKEREHPLLFAYLNFDRSELDAQYPLTLLSEAARQVSLQAPELVEPLAGVRLQIDQLLQAQMALRNEEATLRGSGSRDVDRHRADEAIISGYFAEVVGAVTGGTPILLVLDTFEMAQRKRRSFLQQLDDALLRMQMRLPALRVVVAGRAPVEGLSVRNVPLEGLDPAQAIMLLNKALEGLRVDPQLLPLVASRVSGNPLSLRLAADLIRREGSRALGSRRARRRLLFGLKAEQVQGVLYRRILDHVHKRVRPLASPGLVVRHITTDVIRQVLAEPCGLAPLNANGAQVLWELLRNEVALVSEAKPGVLVHRADVRREMLPLLEAEDAGRVRDIHERAVAYYQGRTEIDAQVEHLYHRLMLRQPSEVLDQHWNDSAARFLDDAWDELPPESRVYLAGRLGGEADPADLAAADRTAWIRQATSQARSLLDSGQPAGALEILQARQLAPRDLSVTRLVVEALAAQGNDAQALQEAQAAVQEADEQWLGLEYVQLSLLAGRIAEDGAEAEVPDGFAIARRHYLEAREGAQDFGARAEAMTAGLGALRIARRLGDAARSAGIDTSGDHRLRHELITEAAKLTDRAKATHPGLLRDLAAELGDELPGLLVDASRHVGVETEGQSANQLPDWAQETLRSATPPPATREPPMATPPLEPPPAAPPPYEHVAPQTSTVTGRGIAEALETSPGDDHLKESLREYWRSEADRPSFDYDEGKKGPRWRRRPRK